MNHFDDLVTVYDTALGEKAANCMLYSDNQNILNGNIRCEKDGKDNQLVQRSMAKISTLDSFIEEIPDDAIIGVIKIDTEGMDYFVLKGGSKFIRLYKPPFIQCEYNPAAITPLGIQP